MENIKRAPVDGDNGSRKSDTGPVKRDPSMKSAFIRVTKVNHTGGDKTAVVIYSAEQIKDVLDEWAWTAGIQYWFIDHVPDDEDINDHFHIVIKFKSPSKFSVIKNKFPFGKIERTKSLKGSIQYLVHLNSPEKLQYSWDQVITNCPDLSPYKVLSASQMGVHLDRVIEKIKNGEITQVNYQKTIPISIYAKYKSAITNAFQYKTDEIVLSDVSRPIQVIYMYGRSGLGKTRLAKDYCKGLYPDEEPCISSSGNDPLQDYKGQKALILDDFRDSSFKYSDLLKLIDPYTRSSSKSRYVNKHFIGDLIVITTTQRIDYLYKNVSIVDNLYELRRRITYYHELVNDAVNVYRYAGNNHFVYSHSFVNPYCEFDSVPVDNTEFERKFSLMLTDKLHLKLKQLQSEQSGIINPAPSSCVDDSEPNQPGKLLIGGSTSVDSVREVLH